MTWAMRDDRSRSAEDMAAFEHLMFRAEQMRNARSTLLAVLLLDRSPDWDRVIAIHDRASRLFLRLRQRVVEPAVPVPAPKWVVDPDFDLSYHLRRVRTPAPGTTRQLLDLAETAMMTPLDPTRPLWETTLVEDLEGGRAALIQKANHAVTDGMGGVKLMSLLYQTERDTPLEPMPAVPVGADVTPGELARGGIARLPTEVVRYARSGVPSLVRSGWRALRSPRDRVDGTRAFLQSAGRVVGPPPAEPSPLLARRGSARRFEVVEVPLAALRGAAKAVGASVNDAYLAAVGGALRHYHDALGLPVDALPAAIPISLRADDDPIGGNRWAGARLAIPTEPADASERMLAVREVMLSVRAEPAIDALSAVAPVMSRSPVALLSMLSSTAQGIDLQASNIPGPPDALFLAGAEIEAQYPFGPLPGPAMMITMLSYRGSCGIGITYDPASVTDANQFRDALVAGFDEVVGAGVTRLPVAARDARTTMEVADDDSRGGTAEPVADQEPAGAAGNGGRDRAQPGGPVDGRVLRL
jgi:diacylglycerol O-acyltransferase